jgi:hypothetical protein
MMIYTYVIELRGGGLLLALGTYADLQPAGITVALQIAAMKPWTP